MRTRPIENVRAVETEQSNSTALVDDRYVVKIYRKLENGLNPEIEIGRFLTDIAGFTNTPALLGSIELTGPDTESAIAIVHAFVENQGDAWTLTSAALDRFVEGQSLVGDRRRDPGQRREVGLSALHDADRQARRRNADGACQPRRHRGFPPRSARRAADVDQMDRRAS